MAEKTYICTVAHREGTKDGFIDRKPDDEAVFKVDPGPYWKPKAALAAAKKDTEPKKEA